MGGVDERGVQVEPAGGAQLGQQRLVQGLPDPWWLASCVVAASRSPQNSRPSSAGPARPPRSAVRTRSRPARFGRRRVGGLGSETAVAGAGSAAPAAATAGRSAGPQTPNDPTVRRSLTVGPTRARCETRSKSGKPSAAGYGEALPRPAEVPADPNVQAYVTSHWVGPLAQYAIPAGQRYVLVGPAVTDLYFAWYIDGSARYDRTDLHGAD